MKKAIEDECAAMLAIKILGRKWIAWIVCELLLTRELFFSDLLNRIEGIYGEKISARVLSESLTRLEELKLLSRTVVSETMPIRVKYSLTTKGMDLQIVFAVLKGWGIKWGNIRQKKCRTFSCIHNSVPMIDIDKAADLLEIKKTESLPSDQIEDSA
ncbi:MAG: winged helix-turn-helix transcriptional regulator [Candidatus Hodarchaeales archaeon]